jgi:hypothetical protein
VHSTGRPGCALLLCVLLAVLASSVPAFAAKQSPVSIIVNAPLDAVKGAAVAEATANGYLLDQEGQFQIVFTKNMGWGSGLLTNLLLAPPACSGIPPRWFLTVMFVPGPEGVTLRAVSQYEHAGPFCRSVRESFDGKKPRQQIEGFFQQIKSAAEQRGPSSVNGAAEGTVSQLLPSEQNPSSASDSQEQARKVFAGGVSAELQKGAVGYADLDGPKNVVLVVHSVHADETHFNNLLANQKFVGSLRIYGFTKFVYTNDHGKTFTWDSSQLAATMRSSPSTQQESLATFDAPQEVTVEFKSTPTGADVRVDGSYVGSTPSSIPLSPGEHNIRISKKDFRTYERTLTVTTENVRVAAYLQQVTVRFDH